MSITVDLSVKEAAALANYLEHAPSCVWAGAVGVIYVDDAGGQWADAEMVVPYVSPECTCGYFAVRDRAVEKLQSALEAVGERF